MSLRWPVPHDAKCLEVNGYPITYRDAGHGPTIVLVHGSLVDYRTWEPTVACLSERFRVIAPSLRHHYPEAWSGVGTDFTIEQHASDIAALVRSLGIEQIHLLGWSRGGLVAVEVARQSAELIKTLILEDGTISLAGEETDAMRQAKSAADNRQSALKAAIQRGEAERGAQQLVDALNGSGAWSRMLPERRQMMLDNIRTALADVRNPVPRDALAGLKMPMLLLTGENSPRSYSEFYEVLRDICRCGPTVVIPRAAHLMHLDNPSAFNEAVMQFVSKY
jgi:pimeloyl-ACP methyl ester carboxylesterase